MSGCCIAPGSGRSCRFDPLHSSSRCHLPFCSLPRLPGKDSCEDCLAGYTPCCSPGVIRCLRRATPGNDGLCTFCKDNTTSLKASPSDTTAEHSTPLPVTGPTLTAQVGLSACSQTFQCATPGCSKASLPQHFFYCLECVGPAVRRLRQQRLVTQSPCLDCGCGCSDFTNQSAPCKICGQGDASHIAQPQGSGGTVVTALIETPHPVLEGAASPVTSQVGSSCSQAFSCVTPGCTKTSFPQHFFYCPECVGPALRRLQRKRLATVFPCVNAGRGCHGFANRDEPCQTCSRAGLPCLAQPHGCHYRVGNEGIEYCKRCLKKGPFCCGPAGNGCTNLLRQKFPRRAAPANKGQCILCRRMDCTVPNCHRPVHCQHWTKKLCCFHARHGVNAPLHVRPRMRLHGNTLDERKQLQRRTCALPWCQQFRRARVFRMRAAGSPPYISREYCRSHAVWFVPPEVRDLTVQRCGFMRGLYSARCTIDNVQGQHVKKTVCGSTGSTPGMFNDTCPYCKALSFTEEHVTLPGREGRRRGYTTCCRNGLLRHLPVLPPAPLALSTLFGLGPKVLPQPELTSDTASPDTAASTVRDFRTNVRRYNAAMAFAAFARERSVTELEKPKPKASNPTGPPVFIMHGRPYHSVAPLHPGHGRKRAFGQLYVFDAEAATVERKHLFGDLREDTLRSLAHILEDAENPYPKHYRHMADAVAQATADAAAAGREPPVAQMCFKSGTEKDPRRYNEPSARSNEIALIYAGEGPPSRHYISVFSHATSEGRGIYIYIYIYIY